MNSTTQTSSRSEAVKKAWITRRANAAAKVALVTATPVTALVGPVGVDRQFFVPQPPAAPKLVSVVVVIGTPTPAIVVKANVPPVVAEKTAKKRATMPREPRVTANQKRKGLTECLCGCGNMVTADFQQGHDARAKGMLISVVKGKMPFINLPAVLTGTERGRAFIARHQPSLVTRPPRITTPPTIEKATALMVIAREA